MTQTLYALNLNEGPNFGRLTTVDITTASALYRDTPTDTLYTAVATAVNALFSGTTRLSATWVKRIVLEEYHSFSWLMVQSDFKDVNGAAVTATVTIADAAGAVLSTTVVSSREPVRLAAFRELELVVTVVSKARITAVHLASTTEELKAL